MSRRALNLLSAREVVSAKCDGKAYKLFDGGGLYLHVKGAGKYWRLKYRYDDREKLLALGVYPDVTLAKARVAAQDARTLLAEQIDPSVKRRADKRARRGVASNTVESVAREWFVEVHRHAVVPTHSVRNLRRLETYIFPYLGVRPISEITTPELLDLLRRIEIKGKYETVHRLKSLCSQFWRYAISTGRAERDIAADLRGCLKPSKVKHHPAIIKPEDLGQLLRAADEYSGFPAACAALRLTPILFCRAVELRQMEWVDLRLEDAEWDYQPAKDGGAMITPLSRQAADILKSMEPLSGGGKYVFPSTRSEKRPMSENTVNAALIGMGYKDRQTAHGFRATARTLLVEVLGFPENIVEMQLAHNVRDPLGRAYNRTTFLEQRREMLQKWADYLDKLKTAG